MVNPYEYQNLSWNDITATQSCLSDAIQRSIIQEVLESQFYRILIDEFQKEDITVQKHLSVCIRYVCKEAPVTKFLTNVSLYDRKAHTKSNVTVKCLEDFGNKLSNMVSLPTDGASVMTGVGVQQKSKLQMLCFGTIFMKLLKY